jgi:pSer/pThr/pTyr-binding forkhead associated (FHA) protein
MRARLVSENGGAPFDLTKDLILVGRNEECDLRLNHKSVSKLHCVIVKTDGLLLLRDLGSTNGTRVNGQRIRRAALLPNDSLSIANMKYQVKFGIDLETELEISEVRESVKAPEAKGPIKRNVLPDVYPEPRTPPG